MNQLSTFSGIVTQADFKMGNIFRELGSVTKLLSMNVLIYFFPLNFL